MNECVVCNQVGFRDDKVEYLRHLTVYKEDLILSCDQLSISDYEM